MEITLAELYFGEKGGSSHSQVHSTTWTSLVPDLKPQNPTPDLPTSRQQKLLFLHSQPFLFMVKLLPKRPQCRLLESPDTSRQALS